MAAMAVCAGAFEAARAVLVRFGLGVEAATMAALVGTLPIALGIGAGTPTVAYCGSGVSACMNIVAMEHAGLVGSRVFAPSWSGWIADRSRPVAKGEK